MTVSEDGRAISRGVAVGLGTPQQILALAPSIVDDNIFVFNAQDCVSASNSSCIGLKGGVYNASSSHTFRKTTQAAWNGTQQAVELTQSTFIFFNDELYFGSDASLDGFPLIMNQPGHGKSCDRHLSTS